MVVEQVYKEAEKLKVLVFESHPYDCQIKDNANNGNRLLYEYY